MNRRHRRAAASKARLATNRARKAPLDRATAIHEAGHAVARILTARMMGWSPEQAVEYIEIGCTSPDRHSADRQALLVSQAVCYGKMLSCEISGHLRGGAASFNEIRKAVAEARITGANIHTWVKAKALIAVFGAAAEARFRGVQIEEIWLSYACENDMHGFAGDCKVCDLDDHAIGDYVTSALGVATDLIADPDVWRAVQAIAEMLPNRGRVEGREIASTALAAGCPILELSSEVTAEER